jgi:hypothetical protein
LHFCHYNFVRHHKTLRISPAMVASVSGLAAINDQGRTGHVWVVKVAGVISGASAGKRASLPFFRRNGKTPNKPADQLCPSNVSVRNRPLQKELHSAMPRYL